ncbi:hypothetical protein GCM10009557_92630 [Virgisporangium ochraceum]|uniref:Uncharacterized protein n=1 Tax=Virgisporangium ochraceum TaxID=65505 RepID=A0A8J4A2C2_9ACTN|nr:hypothetical protein [Virgisporangium ochraceum]GIJ74537.1 hypothetical protein Voc01_094540 [Virgisporangium ochraceum]
MSDLSRRKALTLGAALGPVTAVGSAPVSAAPTTAAADPWWVWDDEVDRLVAGLLDNGEVPAVNTAMRSWVDNRDPLPAAFPADLTAWLQRVNKLPSWADPVARALVRTAWPAFIAMLFLNKGASGSTTLITIPTGNRP